MCSPTLEHESDASWLPAIQTELLARGPDSRCWQPGCHGHPDVSVTDWCCVLLCDAAAPACRGPALRSTEAPPTLLSPKCWHAHPPNIVSSNHPDVLNNSKLLKINVIFKNNYRLLLSFETEQVYSNSNEEGQRCRNMSPFWVFTAMFLSYTFPHLFGSYIVVLSPGSFLFRNAS